LELKLEQVRKRTRKGQEGWTVSGTYLVT